MGVLIDWLIETETSGEMLLVAMPGVGDVGKLAIDAVNSEEKRLNKFIHSNDDISFARFSYVYQGCLLYTSPSPRDLSTSRMPSSA